MLRNGFILFLVIFNKLSLFTSRAKLKNNFLFYINRPKQDHYKVLDFILYKKLHVDNPPIEELSTCNFLIYKKIFNSI